MTPPRTDGRSANGGGPALNGPGMDERLFRRLREFIHSHTGIHLTPTKKAMVVARLNRRLRSLGLQDFEEYYHHLTAADPDGVELERMINRITTNQTGFFREKHHFDYLKNEFLPRFRQMGEARNRRKLRAWSAACSYGQEAYSLAMVLEEAFRDAAGWDIRLLATDLDTEALKAASRGEYTDREMESVPRNLRLRHFQRVAGHQGPLFRIRPETRRMVVFRRLNLHQARLPFRVDLDFIFCRNVIIYFNQPDKLWLMGELHRVLADSGLLFVGHSESLMSVRNLFEYVSDTVYKKVVA